MAKTLNSVNGIPKIKKKMPEKVLFQMEDEVSKLTYQLGDNSDPYYPTWQEILTNVDINSTEGIRFLLWCTHPRPELKEMMTPEQKECMDNIRKMLYTIDVIPDEESTTHDPKGSELED